MVKVFLAVGLVSFMPVAFAQAGIEGLPSSNDVHLHAQKAAEATHSAEEQGKFWEYHDVLFASQKLDVPQLKEHARTFKLDGEAFDKCLDSGAEAHVVKNTLEEGTTLGIQGTPSFLINGRFFGGSLHYEDLQKIIDEELKSAALKTAAS